MTKKFSKAPPPPKKEKFIEKTIRGILRVHPRGFGFVTPDDATPETEDIFIPKHLTDNAVDGDHVEVELNPNYNREKGPDGKILAILKRGRTHLAGTVRDIDNRGIIHVHVPLLGTGKGVIVHTTDKRTLKRGDRIIMKVDEWGDERSPTFCLMTHYIGHISDPSCDIPAAVEEYGLRNTFTKEVIKQAKGYGTKVLPKDLKGRKDLSKLFTFTIDPETARDFDDALSLSKDQKGIYHLAVHIADVAHYVTNDSPLDKEAKKRCNSTYFPGFCLPMLPEELSNNLCSLKPNVIRLTASVLMDFDSTGKLLRHQIVRSFIKSNRRFTYEEAKKLIDSKKKDKHTHALKLMVELCLLLKQKRSERGSIDFSLPDLVIDVDKSGQPLGIKKVEYDISHQLVEEYMLKANEMVATHLSNEKKPVLYRIHEEPSEENMQDFFSLARSLGFFLQNKPGIMEIQALFEQAKKTPFSQQLSVAFIKSMKLAHYSPENIGHFGLALEYYCHFTSPIRRYTDLVTQRILFDEQPEEIDLNKVALECSEGERVSFRAETSVKLLKKLRLLQRYLNEDSQRSYTAIISRVKPFGLFFEITELLLEGFLHISELENDYFLYDDKRHVLFGKSSGKRHFVGEPIQVRVSKIDLVMQETQWELVSSSPRRKR